MTSCGKLIVFEGPDGVGKSTLSQAVVSYLTDRNIKCHYLAFPGRNVGTLGWHVYNIHHDHRAFGIEAIHPTSLQLLHVASHIDLIETQIKPLLQQGIWIILDRWWWSTWVYGKSAGIENSVLESMLRCEQLYWDSITPERVFLIQRSSSFRSDEISEQWQSLATLYTEIADKEQNSYSVSRISNQSSLQSTLSRIISLLDHDEIKLSPPEQLMLSLVPRISPKKHPLITTISSVAPAKPTKVFDTFWYFAFERQNIFFRRLRNEPPPWTSDPILSHYKFTNAYRASDRVSQFLIKHVIYDGEQSLENTFFRIMLFKFFNKIETWKLLEDKLQSINYYEYNYQLYDRILTNAIENNVSIFSGAYIMPSRSGNLNHQRKHRNYLELLAMMMKAELPYQIAEMKSMRQAFELLRTYPLMGDFLAYQYVIDMNYSQILNFSEMEFVIPGPGARDGIHKCFSSLGGLNEADIIRLITENQQREFERLNFEFASLWGRDLQLIDCQNLFCEVSKYARIAHPESKGVSDRTRIKQIYQGTEQNITYWYPPKWNINDRIQEQKEIS